MPNGGSDNCGTCWYNNRHEGQKGHVEGFDLPCRCLLRADGKLIMDPLFTYCANHPYHDPQKHPFPVGPIYAGEAQADGWRYRRRAFRPSPDTEAIRGGLLKVLESLPEAPPVEHPGPTRFEEEVVRQLGEFREARAVAGLKRVLAFHPLRRGRLETAPDEVVFGADMISDRQRLIGAALEAVAKILGESAAAEIAPFVRAGLSAPGKPLELCEKLALVRASAVRALTYCGAPGRTATETALEDPVAWVADEARQALG